MRVARDIRAHPDAAAVLALIVLPFLVFGRALMPGRVLSSADVLFTTYPWRGLAPGLRPGNDLLTDPAHLFQPWLIYAVGEVWQGRRGIHSTGSDALVPIRPRPCLYRGTR